MLPTLTVHAAGLLVRRHAGVVGWRIVLEILAAGLLGWCGVTAWDIIRFDILHAKAWAAGIGIILIGLTAHLVIRVIYRAGTIRVMNARIRGTEERGVLLEGIDAFVDALAGTYALALLDLAWMGCVALELLLAFNVKPAWVPAVCIAFTLVAGIMASAFGTFSYVLGLVDGVDAAEAWPRLRRVLGSSSSEARGRFVVLALLLAALGSVLTAVDHVSAITAQLGESADFPALLIFVPLLSAATACIIDVAVLLYVVALTDRLPLGLAARVSIA